MLVKVKWLKNNKPTSLIEIVKGSMRITTDDTVSFRPNFDILIDVLADKIEHSYDFDQNVFYDLFKEAVIAQFKKDQLKNEKNLLPSFKHLCDKHSINEHKYILLTSINLSPKYKLSSRLINGQKVSFYSCIPKKYIKERVRLFEKFKEEYELTERGDYQYCTVSVTAPDPVTAFSKALESLDIIRSLMQVGFERNRNILAFDKEGEYPTQSIITLGKFHSLHLHSGKAARDSIWYENTHNARKPTTIRNFSTTQSYLHEQITRLKKTEFKEHVSEALVAYIEALDKEDASVRFLKLWSVLEQLVHSDDTKAIIQRVSFFYESTEENKSVVESLRRARNIHVHKGSMPRNIEIKNFLLCEYIELLINFFLRNPFRHTDLNSAIDFISTSTDVDKIDKQIKKLQDVRTFIGAN